MSLTRVIKRDSLMDQINRSTFTVTDPVYSVVSVADTGVLSNVALTDRLLAVVSDRLFGEMSLVIESSALAEVTLRDGCKAQSGYRCIRFALFLPFDGAGFIATLTGAISRRGINLLCLSGYSCDYILVKDSELNEAVRALKEFGMKEKSQEGGTTEIPR